MNRASTNGLLLMMLLLLPSALLAGEDAIPVSSPPPLYLIIPFIALLLAIAIAPFINRRWWETRYQYVSIGLGLITLAYYVAGPGAVARMLETGTEYFSFISLIGSLFVVAGGIHIRMKGRSTALTNVTFLAVGSVLANLLGTTGASMILIRPWLRVNNYRLKPYHIVFFIFLVSNIGGALTPIGDPPLFLGYLKGVPFFWVLEHCWPIWAVAVSLLLLLFYVMDRANLNRFERESRITDDQLHEKTTIEGLHNLPFLGLILVSVFIVHPMFLREGIMIAAACGSYLTTRKEIHERNDFTFLPLKEVAILFVGIFVTMVPALDWLEANAASIGITSAGQFFWGSGVLSSVLDNAPTYLTFLTASIGLFVDREIVTQVQHLVSTHGSDIASVGGMHAMEIRNTFETLIKYHSDLVATGNVPLADIQISYLIGNHNLYLMAVSMGAVFFGAVTYIGNGPNFMVKSIADHAGAHCPGFAGYIARYSLPMLFPLFLLVWWFFFRA